MKHYLFFSIFLLGLIDVYGQVTQDNSRNNLNTKLPSAIYIAPLLDGGSLAIEYTIRNKHSLNLYAFKRQSDESIYYDTKVNETLVELFLKIYFRSPSNKKFNPFFGPAIGAKTIVYDESFGSSFGNRFGSRFRKDLFVGPFDFKTDAKAKAFYFNPSYIGFDFVSRNGLIFEYAAGMCFQYSTGDIRISGPIYMPYMDGYNIRSRMLFGYRF